MLNNSFIWKPENLIDPDSFAQKPLIMKEDPTGSLATILIPHHPLKVYNPILRFIRH